MSDLSTPQSMPLFFSAVDVWLFRDGRPFDAFSHRRAESLFPPHPSVLQGAVRSYELVQRGIPLNDSSPENKARITAAVGDAETPPPGFHIRGPWVARWDGVSVKRYFPLPADAWLNDDKQAQPASAPATLTDDVRCSLPAPMLLGISDEPAKPEDDLWIEEGELKNYLDPNQNSPVRTIKGKDLFAREARPGIAMQNTARVTREGALFEVDYIRPGKDIGLYAEVDGFNGWPQTGALCLGGESRAARFTRVTAAAPLESLGWQGAGLPARFKIYLTTPAYFENGWLPQDPTWAQFFGAPVNLEAAAVARYESLGGYDTAKHEHKPARRFVPAGSVYYFSVPQGTPDAPRPERANRAITDWGAAFGYGQYILQEW